jgi:hypothetical protein
MCCPCWLHPHHLELCVHLSAMCSTGDVVLTGSYRTVTVSSSGISSLYVGGVTEVSSQQCGWTQAGAGLSWPKSTSGLRFGWQSAGIEHGTLLAAALALVGSCSSQQAAGGAALLFPAALASCTEPCCNCPSRWAPAGFLPLLPHVLSPTHYCSLLTSSCPASQTSTCSQPQTA